jgi:hypothetical protein
MNKRLLLWFIIGIIIAKSGFYLVAEITGLKSAGMSNIFTDIFSFPYGGIFISFIVMILTAIFFIPNKNFIRDKKYWFLISMFLGNVITIVAMKICGDMIIASL